MDLRKDLKNLRSGNGGIAGWVKWAIREKTLVYLCVLALIVLGGLGLVKMNKDEFPTFQLKQGLVVGIYPGSTAAEVESQLTRPLEEYLFSFKEVERKSTHSVTRDGICYIYVDLRVSVPQSKKDEVWSKIKLGLQARKQTLPSGVLAVAVLDDFANTSSILLAVESDDKSYFELQDYTDDLCDRLRQIPDLAKAETVGTQEEEFAVILDREKISSYGIDPSRLMFEYQASSISAPAGTFNTSYTSAPIHIQGALAGEREVAERIIYSDPEGNVVRLKDIATIVRRYKDPSSFVSYNGHACLILNIEMRPDHDIVAFGREVDKVLEEYAPNLPDSVKMSKVCDQPRVVSTSVWSFLRDLLISMLVVIFVMLMLFPMRSALIASSGVPVCTAVAVAIMYLTGMPLNTVTLAALIVVLGMIVDDSIITMDGYMDKMSRGYHGADAAAESAKELFMPTFVATLAICLMFFPVKLIITGYLGDFVSLFPWVILIALMTSLFYAVTVVPSIEVKYIKPVDPDAPKNAIARIQDKFFNFLQGIYERCLRWCFSHPAATITGGVLSIALGVVMFLQLNIQMMPSAARKFFVVEMYTEAGNGIDKTKFYADSLQTILLKDKRVESVTSFIGTGAPRFNATYTPVLPSPQTAQLIVNTTSSRATEDLLKMLERDYEHIFPEVLIRYKQMDYNAAEAPIVVMIKGDDRNDLLRPAEMIQGYLTSLSDETKWVHSDADNFEPSVIVDLDPDESARLGVTKAMLSLSLAGTFNGEKVASIWEGDREIPVNIYSESVSDTMDYEVISNQLVNTSFPGVSVPLRQVADVRPDWALAQLCRDNGRETVNVYADLKMDHSQPAVEKKVKKFIKREVEPILAPGVTIEYAGLTATNADVIPEIAWSFLAACSVLFIFLLLHFHKASIAALTMALSSLCLFGASFGLWIFGLDFCMTAVLGLISLVGIIVRNGILMFEYAEDARFKEGMDIKTASFQAGQRRMRPIFLTSCTTALGVLPMIISGDLLWMPMGVAICFGTMFSIFLITLIMPVAYWQLFKKGDKAK
ncbi:MAG: efflux RND transporter permease subunit [Bacteroidales bacterium]|nr:efflux RND transporter permease subunit [Bacteroidales bacterium]